jgi:predicted permease
MPNFRLALRTLFRTPFVTAVAIISLALGIGANAAIFSLFDQVLLRPLPVEAPGELINLSAPGPKPGSNSCGQAGGCEDVFSYAMFRDLERDSPELRGLAAHVIFGANLAYTSRQTIDGNGLLVSGGYFPVLGLRPALGRLLDPGDDRTPGESAVVVLSYDYWRTKVGGDPSIVNRTIVVNGVTLTIVGVAPEGFHGTTLGARPMVFAPITMRRALQPFFNGFDDRRNYWAYLFARPKHGVSLQQVASALNVRYHAIINDVEAPLQKGMSEKTLARFKAKELVVSPGGRGQSSTHREARAPLTLLFVVTGVVLIIACANIANLLLARSAARSGEMAVRLSIGASRGRLVGQLLTESCLLALFGGVAGLLVARGTLAFIGALLPPDATESLTLAIDGPVLLFALALAVTTGMLFGLFPAVHSTRPDLASTLKGIAGQPSGGRGAAWFRQALVTSQIALSMALLGSAGLFLKSLVNVSHVDLGLRIDNLVTFGLSPRQSGYTPERSRALFQQIEETLAATPGVASVTGAVVALLADENWGNSMRVQGFQDGPDVDRNSRVNEVGPDYFHALGIPLRGGREFTPADAVGAPKVAIVNEAFAKKFNLGQDAVGKYVAMGNDASGPLDIEIVGVAQNTKYSSVKDPFPPVLFRPYRQDEQLGSLSFYVRTNLEPAQFLQTVPKVMAQIDSNLPVQGLKTMPQQVRENVMLDRLISTLAASFAVLATILASVGLYGVLAYTVTQRTREFGLRMALGAQPSRVRGLVLRQVGKMTVIGGATGIAIALLVGHAAESLLFQMKGWDPVVFAATAVLLAVVAAGAGIIPAIRASRIEPMQALRYE